MSWYSKWERVGGYLSQHFIGNFLQDGLAWIRRSTSSERCFKTLKTAVRFAVLQWVDKAAKKKSIKFVRLILTPKSGFSRA